MTGKEINAIIDRILGGQVDAYGEIIRTFQDSVWRVVAFGLHDIETTEDLVQQVFVNAYFKLDRFQRNRDFGAWLRGIARNLLREEMRRRRRYTRRLATYRDRQAERLGDNSASDRHEERLREALAECRETLSPAASEALDMRYTRARGFGELAAALERTVAATRQMLGRIRLALRTCIEERMARS